MSLKKRLGGLVYWVLSGARAVDVGRPETTPPWGRPRGNVKVLVWRAWTRTNRGHGSLPRTLYFEAPPVLVWLYLIMYCKRWSSTNKKLLSLFLSTGFHPNVTWSRGTIPSFTDSQSSVSPGKPGNIFMSCHTYMCVYVYLCHIYHILYMFI